MRAHAAPAEHVPLPAKTPLRTVHHGAWVALEPLSSRHAEALWPLARDHADAWNTLPAGPFPSERAFEAYLRFMERSSDEFVWSVRPRDANGTPASPAGWLALLDVQPAHARVEIGNVWFPPGLARTRAATEAVYLLLAYAFEDLNAQRVSWKCDPVNGSSRRAAERLGFRFEGVLRSHLLFKRRRRDTAYFSLLAEEWPEQRRAFREWLAPDNFDGGGMALTRLRRTADRS
ncbi:MAG: GNAT family N-acetyltransferase [Acetobacteraceae bacterium]|nr:GNAT family N-acetyltransferase [Acetobacteraceae bacterium]